MLSYKSGNLRAIFKQDTAFEKVEKSDNFTFAEHTTYGLGGRAKVAYFPKNILQARVVYDRVASNEKQYAILGNGSNILASCNYFDGAVICTKRLSGIVKIDKNTIFCLAGTSVNSILKYCLQRQLGGLEYLYGIPATIGGIACMNGGAGGTYISSNIKSVMLYNGKIVNLPRQKCQFSNKHSTMRDIKGLILGVLLSVSPISREIIEERIRYYKAARAKQPKGKSCGCVFKNEGDIPSGKLIDMAGLKGTRIGDAYVSCEHANFIINCGASAYDVKKLIDYVKSVVLAKFGVRLHEEVVFIGDFD